MDDINQLKQEQKQAFTQEQVTQLKVEEIEQIEVDEQPVYRSSGIRNNWSKCMLWVGVGLFAVMFVSGGFGAAIGTLWPLVLLVPAFSNLRAAYSDKRSGVVNNHTRRMLTRGVLALVFMALFLTNSWGVLWPLLLVAIGASWLVTQRWQMLQNSKLGVG